MRTLKKTLCLVLVVVMMAGLCSIGTSAAFVDADKINYVQAAEVLNGLGVMKGDENGFRPQDGITRAEACVMITRILGVENIKATASSFTDLAGYGWAKDAIAFCEAEGIVAGNGDGTFNPAGKLTGYAFAKMLFCAAGMDAEYEGMIGANWEIGVAKQVKKWDIAKHISAFDGTAACTREEAAELAFEALLGVPVFEYKEGTSVSGGDITVNVGGEYANPNPTTKMIAEFFNIDTMNDTANKLYQPVTHYENAAKGSTIKFDVAKTPVATFTAKTTAAAIATALDGYSLLADGSTTTKIALNNTKKDHGGAKFETGTYTFSGVGAEIDTIANTKTSAEILAGLTANGTVVEFYANDKKCITDIVVIKYTTAKVTDITKDASGNVTYTVTGLDAGSTNLSGVDYADKTADTIVFAAAPAKGDIVTVAQGNGVNYLYATTNTTATLTTTKTERGVQTVTIGGTKYTVGASKANVTFDTDTKAAIYYFDQYGYVVYTDNTAASTDYAMVHKVNGKLDTTIDGKTPAVEARAILADGTVAVYNVVIEKLKTGDARIGETSADNNSVTLAAGDYVVKGTKICVFNADASTDAAAVTALADYLEGKIFGYTLSSDAMTLELLADDTVTFEENKVVTGQTYATVAAKATAAKNSENSETILFNKATKIVVYNSTTKIATVYNGTGALPAGYTASQLDYVAKCSSATSATASVAFLTVSTAIESGAGTDLVYINYATGEEIMAADGTVTYEYTGTYANGTTVTLTAKSDDALTESGLYKFSGTTVKDSFLMANNENVTDESGESGDQRFYYTTDINVVDGMAEYDTGKFANITDDTQIVYLAAGANKVADNGGYVVLGKGTNNTLTGDVAMIFITVNNQ